MAGVWIGCDDRFVRLENNLGYGGQAARPIYEYFFQKALKDKTLGLDRQAKFVQPENLKNEEFYDYPSIIENTMPAGAEGEDVGNGAADAYLSREDTGNVPVESKASLEEAKVLPPEKQNSKKDQKQDSVAPDKKKRNIFRRIFGKKDRDNED
jgi:penicillin-binding protein 1A